MASHPVYTTLNVPTVTSYPSVRCLQWSSDGQACFATKTAAYIMTPDHGVHFDASSVIKSVKERKDHEGTPSIGWFRTIIPFEKSDLPRWPEYSQAWGAVSLGSIDVALWDVTFSPSGLSPDSGCILAGLTSNMDLTLWTASKNCLKGEWIKACEVTTFLLETFAGDTTSTGQTVQALNSQTTSMTWSRQADFGLTPTPPVDGSLLIVGNRAGSLVFLRYRPNETVQHVLTVPVMEAWLTHVSCSSWTPIKPGTCEALVAYAAADGSVQRSKVTQSFSIEADLDPPELRLTFDASEKISLPDKTSVTALSWVEIPHERRVLVYCKPGKVFLWCHSSSNLGWSGSLSYRLKTQKLSVGSSSLHPASGIQYIARQDLLILTLFDGSFHVIYNLSGEPTMTPPMNDTLVTSEKLSQAVRSVFVQTENDVDSCDMNRVTGLTSYDGSSTFIWVQEASRPSDFSYKHDAKHNSTLLVSSLWNDNDDDALVNELQAVFDGAKI
ncbi:Profilin-2, partial [Termitomyces sp. T112]